MGKKLRVHFCEVDEEYKLEYVASASSRDDTDDRESLEEGVTGFVHMPSSKVVLPVM